MTLQRTTTCYNAGQHSTIYLFIIKFYTKYKIDRRTENEKKKRKQHMNIEHKEPTSKQAKYNQTCKDEHRQQAAVI